MILSFWDKQELNGSSDYVVIGSGITGLSTAIHLKQAMPRENVAILERGMLPWGASTRNAGFTCFGSMGELVSDLNNHTEEEVLKLVKMRVKGLELLMKLVNPKFMQHQQMGNYELFTRGEEEKYFNLVDQIPTINKLLQPIFKNEVFSVANKSFGFKGAERMIWNRFEGMLNTGAMMFFLLERARKLGVTIYNGASVDNFTPQDNAVHITLENGLTLEAKKLALCTNAFSGKFLPELDIAPARNQVLITKPIKKLPFQGAFHMQDGHVYFRTVGQRVLIGGGRHHFPEENNTSEIKITQPVQEYLEGLLRETILPSKQFEIDHRWAGIIGIGEKKMPIVKKVAPHTFAAVRLGGMGVALGSLLGKNLSRMIIADS